MGPGGISLCFQAFCCPCLVLGNLNQSLKLDGSNPCPGGCIGGCCLGCLCAPCYMCSAATAVARKSGKEESKCKACCCSTCCSCCYLTQVYRETLIVAAQGGAEMSAADAPLQQTMDDACEA